MAEEFEEILEEVNETVAPVATDGLFNKTLKRNSANIRSDRAEAIGEQAQIKYKRTIEDLQLNIKDLQREQANLLDMSPDNITSLIMAKNFNAQGFCESDITIGLKIRDEKIKLEVASERYVELFGRL